MTGPLHNYYKSAYACQACSDVNSKTVYWPTFLARGHSMYHMGCTCTDTRTCTQMSTTSWNCVCPQIGTLPNAWILIDKELLPFLQHTHTHARTYAHTHTHTQVEGGKSVSVEVGYTGHHLDPSEAVLLLVSDGGRGTSLAFHLLGRVTGAIPQVYIVTARTLYTI